MNADEVVSLLRLVARQALAIDQQNDMLSRASQEQKNMLAEKTALQAELDTLKLKLSQTV